jgi:hypothetical protein
MFIPGINVNKSLADDQPINQWSAASVSFASLEEASKVARQWATIMTIERLYDRSAFDANTPDIVYYPVVRLPDGGIIYV